MIEARISEPRREDVAYAVEDWADTTGGRSHKIDVLRITQRLREVQFVECRSTTEAKLLAQERIVEKLDKRPRNDESCSTCRWSAHGACFDQAMMF